MNDAIKARKPFYSSNTIVEKGVIGSMNVILHGNTIATVYADNTVVLDSCGWQTNTTKSRLNAILEGLGSEWGVIQRNYEWYLKNYRSGETKEFQDGITLRF